ncbi:hypothetical protein [Corynebacterium sp. HMSC06G04]|nr:hypothetical protein [Corynebacterium sp. HMSC06G04]
MDEIGTAGSAPRAPVAAAARPALALVAAFVGPVRLIDNLLLD